MRMVRMRMMRMVEMFLTTNDAKSDIGLFFFITFWFNVSGKVSKINMNMKHNAHTHTQYVC